VEAGDVSAGLSSAEKAELYAGTTTGEWVVLVTVTHADFVSTLRYVNTFADVVSGGDTYTALAFSAALPADRDGPAAATLTLDNTDQATTVAFRSVTSPPTITLEIVRLSAPDTIVRTFPNLRMVSANISETQVVLGLAPDAVFDDSYPGQDFTPLAFPAGFDR